MKPRQILAACTATAFVLLLSGCAQDASLAGSSSASADQSAYGGTGTVRTVAGHRQGACSASPNCDIFFGQ
ncbi:hypothetical protein B0G84_7127 [Paraburkholderia sp. BL8N3]|nr:hypothetical protein [Paraburkholderia sp. BL8N3]TCK35161.1 hypothetical protein B0G84_7127 [Paraburkholderia sp. BL8N3]